MTSTYSRCAQYSPLSSPDDTVGPGHFSVATDPTGMVGHSIPHVVSFSDLHTAPTMGNAIFKELSFFN